MCDSGAGSSFGVVGFDPRRPIRLLPSSDDMAQRSMLRKGTASGSGRVTLTILNKDYVMTHASNIHTIDSAGLLLCLLLLRPSEQLLCARG